LYNNTTKQTGAGRSGLYAPQNGVDFCYTTSLNMDIVQNHGIDTFIILLVVICQDKLSLYTALLIIFHCGESVCAL